MFTSNKHFKYEYNFYKYLSFQIIFDSFTVGRFDEGMVDSDIDGYESNVNPAGELPGCPEGFMQASF